MSLATYTTLLNARGLLNDHKGRYRRRSARPRRPSLDSAALLPEAVQPEPSPHAQAAHARANARWQRITELNARLTATLDGEGRALWLALEEALHVHWLEVAVDHYQRGYEAGRAQAWLDHTLAHGSSTQDKLRALAAALNELVDQLDNPA